MNVPQIHEGLELPRAAKPAVQERLLDAARELATRRPLAEVTLADVARAAQVSWPTVRRYLGSKENLHAILQRENLDRVPSAPGTRELLLEAAARVFARAGVAGATLDDVGAEAHMTKGAVYWHFANKAELLLALARTRAARHLEGMPERVAAALAMSDAREGLSRIIALQLAAVKGDPEGSRLFLEFLAESRDGAVREQVALGYRRAHSQTSGLTENLRRQGRLSEKAEGDAFAIMWSALVDGLSLLCLVDPDRVDPETLAPKIVELVWNGMKRRYGGL
jgi:TetR/AcrR family acrAB operon transcriptional repressor